MSAVSLAVCGAGAVVAAVNVVTMRRLWASPIFERPQKIAQSVMLWLVPGSFIVVRQVLGDHRIGRSLDGVDATASNDGGHGLAGSIGSEHNWDSGGGGGGFGDGGGGGGGSGGD